ncbi:hypothetical protein [Arthrobacter sp. D5-1]|uniref:hypothetical protein n=1 Tax=Arthrobacter sp. D5-1 TaxID=1477518 RepID=UPI001A99DD62|nr:hypothetical protein [Arthrobacter sp. D5-1]
MSRFNDLSRRGSMVLSRLTKGEDMKLALGVVGAAAVLAAAVVVGVQANAADGQDGSLMVKAPMEDRVLGGYEGWWTSTPVAGNSANLPQETIAVNTTSGEIVDVFNRAKSAAGQEMSVSDVQFNVVPDTMWPKQSVVIIDTASGKVIEDFPVDEKGFPIISGGN